MKFYAQFLNAKILLATAVLAVGLHAEEPAKEPVKKAVVAVDDAVAKEMLANFKDLMRTKVLAEKQDAVFNLAEVPHDLVIKELTKVLRKRDPEVRTVAALALGGQKHNPVMAGGILMRAYDKEFKNELVLSSVIEGLQELGYMKYWPKIEKAMKDPRSAIVIRLLNLLGANKDLRALPKLIDMYHVAMPKRATWKTGEVTVDTGAAGTADADAAKAKWESKYGKGGSKAKRKAKAAAAAFDERNFATQLRRCVKKMTGEDFENSIDLEDWYLENYIAVWKKIAELNGKNVEKAATKARGELPLLKEKIEKKRKALEEQLKKEREAKAKKG